MRGISVCTGVTGSVSFLSLLSAMWGRAIQPGRGLSPEPNHDATLVLDFYLPDCEKYISVVYKAPSLRYFITAAQIDKDYLWMWSSYIGGTLNCNICLLWWLLISVSFEACGEFFLLNLATYLKIFLKSYFYLDFLCVGVGKGFPKYTHSTLLNKVKIQY